jgi:hypothetical protein
LYQANTFYPFYPPVSGPACHSTPHLQPEVARAIPDGYFTFFTLSKASSARYEERTSGALAQ